MIKSTVNSLKLTTKIPDGTRIVSMVPFKDTVIVATEKRVYQLTKDNVLIPIAFKVEGSKK